VGSIEYLESIAQFSQAMMLLADSDPWRFVETLMVIGKVAVGLGFVVFIHELGHFLAAKTFGVRCDKFYVGFDVPIRIGPIHLPRTLGKFQWGETEYGIGIIPLGGYVKMLGQDDDPRNAQEEAERTRLEQGPDSPLDPRSYPAKPVWQRMIIISAGVVLNLVSAVFLAAGAYYLGVPYAPSLVGTVNAGGPAWQAGLQPGDQILRVGSDGQDDPNLRFTDLMTGVVVHGFKSKGQPLEVHIDRGGNKVVLEPVPSPRYDQSGKLHLLGFTGDRSTQLTKPAISTSSPLAAQSLDLVTGDRIVAVDDQALPVDQRFGQPVAAELIKRLQARWNQPVKLTIQRSNSASNAKDSLESPQKLDVTLPPVPQRTLGIGFAMGPVTAVLSDSAGQAAGFKPGDLVTAIDGIKIEDALRVPEIFAAGSGRNVVFTVQRDDGDKREQVEIQVQSPAQPVFDGRSIQGSGELSLGGVGVAFAVDSLVTWVDPQRVAAGQIQVGDRLLQYRWAPTQDQTEATKDYLNVKLLTKAEEIDSFHNVVFFQELLQSLPLGSKLACHFNRDGKTISADLQVLESLNSFSTDERDLLLAGLTQTHRTTDWTKALSLGLWETKRRFEEVLGFLRLLFTGRVGMGGVAGPVKLFDFAAQEASEGTSRLLIFLTMLSANLAILNFLPIPALDGGHMLFLTFEAIRGKPLNEELQVRLTMAGVLGLLTLMAFVILKDIYSYVG
jgi:regulator of sigma E protease